MPPNPDKKLCFALLSFKNLGSERDSHDCMISDLVQVRQASSMPSVPVSDPQRLGKTPQTISLISIQKCEKLKAKNFTSAGKWLAHRDSKPQKENDVNTFFCCAIKSCWDTMGCCQSLTPDSGSRLSTLFQTSDDLCTRTMHRNHVVYQSWSTVCIPRVLPRE